VEIAWVRPQSRMNIAIVGCGYVAELYSKTLGNYPSLKLVGAYDRNEKNLQAFCHRWSARRYASLQQMLEDTSIQLVLNLTNPRSHYEVTKHAIEAGKHVYSEKPLAIAWRRKETFISLPPHAACWEKPLKRCGKPSGKT
jgi:predicted dehydrogenase